MRLFDCERETGRSNTQRRKPAVKAARIPCSFSRLDLAIFGWQGARKETREADSPVSVSFSGECRSSAYRRRL